MNNHYIISVVLPDKPAEGDTVYWSRNPLILGIL